MIQQNPILIAGSPRSGTTMLAGLIHFHDVWTGRTRTSRYPKTNPGRLGTENQDIKALIKQFAWLGRYRNWNVPLPEQPKNFDGFFKAKVELFVPENTRWLVKTSWVLIYYVLWMQSYPEARWVLPYRDIDSIIDSMNRHPAMRKHPHEEKVNYVTALQERQNEIRPMLKYQHTVDAKKISQKDEDEIAKLFRFLEIPMQQEIIDKWLNPNWMK